MKKFTILFAMTAMALALTACGGNGENVETEAAPTEATGEQGEASGSGTAAELPDEYEPEYFEGILTGIKGSQITLTDTDGESMSFDISSAELGDDDSAPLLTGSDVEVEYAVVEGAELNPAATVSVLMDIEQQADMENRDPVIYGTLQIADINELVIIDDSGEERSFDNQISRTVAFGDVKTGDRVAVTYAGELLGSSDDDGDSADNEFSTPVSLKIVAEDAIGSEEAEANYITGIVDAIYDDGIITLIADPVTFEVHFDEGMADDIEEESTVRVYYDGALSGISVDATKIEKAE